MVVVAHFGCKQQAGNCWRKAGIVFVQIMYQQPAIPQTYPGGQLRLSLERYKSVREWLSREVRELLSTGLLDRLSVDRDCDREHADQCTMGWMERPCSSGGSGGVPVYCTQALITALLCEI